MHIVSKDNFRLGTMTNFWKGDCLICISKSKVISQEMNNPKMNSTNMNKCISRERLGVSRVQMKVFNHR